MRRGSAAPTRTPMACCASTYPRALTCRCSRKPNSTPSPPGSTAGRARRLALRHPMRCSPRWWTRPPTPSRHEMRRVFVMELESAIVIGLNWLDGLVDVPAPAGLAGPPLAQTLGQQRRQLGFPVAHRLVGEHDAADQ